MIGAGEAIIVGGILVLLFGASQIPKVARSIGEGINELKKSLRDAKEIDDFDDKSDKK
jgi:sec-independent protein translocase protein TatA